MRTVDHVIIGSGMAGLCLRRLLGPGSVVLDPAPGGYKVGESVVPEQFSGPPMDELLPAVHALPSMSPKQGVVFCSDAAVVAFPAGRHAARAMHVLRSDVEELMASVWAINVARERVLDVDFERRVVRTDVGQWQSRGPIVDCSGPAMVLSRLRGATRELWPVWATWGYYRVDNADKAGFERQARAAGKSVRTLDVPDGRLVDADRVAIDPTAATLLTRVQDGLWTWQIPLYDRRVLSCGVVSRTGPVDPAIFERVIRANVAGCWHLGGRVDPHDHTLGVTLPAPLGELHSRAGFAQRSLQPASASYVCLGDAAQFADPVYSVGTAAAVADARTLAGRLARREWTAADAEQWCQERAELWDKAVRAFGFWYDGSAFIEPAAAAGIQRDFLLGGAFAPKPTFTTAAAGGYGAMIATAMQESVRDLADAIEAALHARLAELDVQWYGIGVESSDADLHVHLGSADTRLTLRINRDGPDVKAFKRGAGLAVSYEGTSTGLTDTIPAAIDALLEHAAAQPEKWQMWLDRARETARSSALSRVE